MKEITKGLNIQDKIFSLRGEQVILDRDLAELYEVETKVLNQAVKRNIERFPSSFRFQLDDFEKNELVTICDRLETLKHSSVNPFAFTEQGVSMLSAILKSKTAILVSIKIIEAFVAMRKFISQNAGIFQRLNNVEKKQIEYQIQTEQNFDKLFKALDEKSLKPKQGIFFEGQIFDAYKFVCDLLKTAHSQIVLLDNYVDESTLLLFSKCEDIKVVIYTKEIDKTLALDLKKYNSQYSPIEIKTYKNSHNRFLIIDQKEVYHFGASLKDLGKKWFAFSKFEARAIDILGKLK